MLKNVFKVFLKFGANYVGWLPGIVVCLNNARNIFQILSPCFLQVFPWLLTTM